MREYAGEVVLVGINYDKSKGHSCKIERISIESVREIGQSVSDKVERVYTLIKTNPSITRGELSRALQVAPSSIQRYINILKQSRIRRVGSDTKGTWKILDA